MINNNPMYYSLKFRSPAMDAIESMNKALEPIRQMQAMTENLKSIYKASNSAFDAFKIVNSAYNRVQLHNLNRLNKNLIIPNFDYMHYAYYSSNLALNRLHNSISNIKSEAYSFNFINNVFLPSLISVPSHQVSYSSNTDVIRDYNVKKTILELSNSKYFPIIPVPLKMRIIQIIYSTTPLDILYLLNVANYFIPDFENYLGVNLELDMAIALVSLCMLFSNN